MFLQDGVICVTIFCDEMRARRLSGELRAAFVGSRVSLPPAFDCLEFQAGILTLCGANRPVGSFANSPLPQDAAHSSEDNDCPPQLVDNLNVPRSLDNLNHCQ